MNYEKYGSTFKKLRLQNNITLEEFSDLGISASSLSRFERGESMISFEKLISALHIMGVSLREFEYFLNNYEPSDGDALVDDIYFADITGSREEMLKLQQEAQKLGYYFISISAKSLLEPLNIDEKMELSQHFRDIKLWNYRELCIFYLSMVELDTSDIINILNSFFESNHCLFSSNRCLKYLIQACCRASAILATRGEKVESENFLNKLDVINVIDSMFLKNLQNFCKGYWIYMFEDISKGDQMMLHSLHLLNTISIPETHAYYQKLYSKYVKYKD